MCLLIGVFRVLYKEINQAKKTLKEEKYTNSTTVFISQSLWYFQNKYFFWYCFSYLREKLKLRRWFFRVKFDINTVPWDVYDDFL